MSVLIEKSKENFESAQILHKQGKYNAATHCTYYSIFQIIMQIYNPENKPNRKGSHDIQIDFLKKNLAERERFIFLGIKAQLGSMKSLREKADYSNEEKDGNIKKVESENFINNSERIISILKQVYKEQLS